jgi:hypothetical protein
MTRPFFKLIGRSVFAAAVAAAAIVTVRAQQIRIPDPGVSQNMTLEGEFVRIAYNREGYVTMGYRVANEFVGQEWMLLQAGITVRDGQPTYKIPRESIYVETPDNTRIPLATNAAYQNEDLRKLEMRMSTNPDQIAYFPPEAKQACRIGLFGSRSFDDLEVSSNRACFGPLYFRIPGGIKHGQYWLNVKFKNSLVRVPFRIMTKDEEEFARKNWKDIKKQVDEAFRKGK